MTKTISIFDDKILSEFKKDLARDIPTNQSVKYILSGIKRSKKILQIEKKPQKWHLVEREFGELLAQEGVKIQTCLAATQSLNRLIRWVAKNHPEVFGEGVPQPIRPFSRARIRATISHEQLESPGKFMSDGELAEIENLLPQNVKGYFRLSLAYGLRRNEAVALCGRPEVVRHGFLLVDRQYDFETGNLKPTKNRRPRKVPHWEISPSEAFELIDGLAPVKPQTLTKSILRACRKLDYEFSWHCLRHTFITRCVRSGRWSIGQIRDAAGHTSIAVTDRYIAAVDFETQESEVFRPSVGENRG